MERLKNLFLLMIIIFMAFSIFSSCSGSQIRNEQTTGVYHRVKEGETAYSISRAYNIKLQDLADINNISDPAVIKEGTVLFIPGAKNVIENVMAHVKEIDKNTTSEQEPIKKPGETPPQEDKPIIEAQKPRIDELPAAKEKIVTADVRKMFIWPVQGSVETRFGRQPNKTYYNWIKIAVAAGTEVKAAANGTVIFSSHLRDYGQTVIIKHQNDFTTVYTHLASRYVKADQRVKQGETIALVGEKDELGKAYINFEIRVKGKADNPLLFLP
ncbi:MAG TPA: M23 family metallopeptidase [Deltaproteobacteria bacterium]|nr:M23 family metallopeptidase [Deltaproteobacteria bacterium]